jgi:hypothetical protein
MDALLNAVEDRTCSSAFAEKELFTHQDDRTREELLVEIQ